MQFTCKHCGPLNNDEVIYNAERTVTELYTIRNVTEDGVVHLYEYDTRYGDIDREYFTCERCMTPLDEDWVQDVVL